MKRYDFIDDMIQRVRDIPILDIVELRIPSIERNGANFTCLCPFHNDAKVGNFSVSPYKNIFYCFACGTGGDGIKFISLMDGEKYIDSAFELALNFRVISSEEYDKYNFNSSNHYSNLVERKYIKIDKQRFESEIANDETLDFVFRELLSFCSVSKSHLDYLVNIRGLNLETIIKRNYKTFPTNTQINEFLKDFTEKYGEDKLKGVPGFFTRENNKTKELEWSFTFGNGIILPISNYKGQIVGLQRRQDEVKENSSRYLWISSVFTMSKENPELDNGTSSGSPIDVTYPDEITNKTILITEGKFKSERVIKEKGIISISIQGVSSWRNITDTLRNVEKHVKETIDKNFSIKNICVAFDADTQHNLAVYNQLESMSSTIASSNIVPEEKIVYLTWNENLGKGIDDLSSENFNQIKACNKKDYDKEMRIVKESIMDEFKLTNESQLLNIDAVVLKQLLRDKFDASSI